MKLQYSIEISKPAIEVFAFVTDHERMPQWISTLEVSTPSAPGPLALNSEFNQEHLERGKRVQFKGQVTEFQDAEKLTLVMKNKDATITLAYVFVAAAGSTGLQQTTELKLHNMMLRMMAGAFEKTVRKRMAADLNALKVLLEA